MEHCVTSTRLLVLLSLSLFLMAPFTRAGLLDELASKIVTSLSDILWRSESMELLGHDCTLTITPNQKGIGLRYRGKVQCQGWATFTGRSPLVDSSAGATELATRDFVRKALDAGLITEEDAKIWL
ncbi:anti-lipopolysaccharide factor-like isoform X2 [Oratosquilla oratoria]